MLHRLLSIATAACLTGVSTGEEMPTIEMIKQAWREREEQSKHVHVRWKERVTHLAGSLSELDHLKPRRPSGQGPRPATNMTFAVEGEMRFAEGRSWYRRSRPMWSRARAEFAIVTDIASWDGSRSRRLTPEGDPDWSYPDGSMRRSPNQVEMFDTLFFPLWLVHRSGGKWLAVLDLEKFHAVRTVSLPDGKRLMAIASSQSIGGLSPLVTEIWVDLRHPYMPHRITKYTNESTEYQITVTYSQSADAKSMPNGWVETRYFLTDSKRVSQVRQVTVEKWEIGTPVPAKEMEVEFPTGTLIFDDTEGPWMHHFVANDGSWNDVDRALFQQGYDVINKKFNSPVQRAKRRALHPAVLAGTVVVMLALSLVVGRRRILLRRRSAAISPSTVK